ncbi:MAG: hypothetical protein NVSMB62_30100 [Acidobacteriaceae bacterium]
MYNLVEDNFADQLSADKSIYNGAIPGMLRTLDPHSSFFDPHSFQLMREDQRGHYYGVGMRVTGRNGKTLVIEPFKGAPAYKAGLRPRYPGKDPRAPRGCPRADHVRRYS